MSARQSPKYVLSRFWSFFWRGAFLFFVGVLLHPNFSFLWLCTFWVPCLSIGFACIYRNGFQFAYKGLSGKRTERSAGALRNVPCIRIESCYDAQEQTDKQGTEYTYKEEIRSNKHRRKRGFPGEPIGKGAFNMSVFCPAFSH